MSAAVLETRELSKWYGQVIGLNDVTVEVPRGITGLLGPNGAGKSTFLKLATGLIRPSRGEIRVLDHEPWNNPDLMARVGLAPEHDTFYDRMTGLEFVTFFARLAGRPAAEAERAARATLERVGLADAMHRRVGAYSKGMRQRAKIAQALVHDPEVLFLDEPLTGTDPIGRRDLIEFIRGLGKAGKSVIVSSHVLHEIEAMTTNILVIHRGRILAEGDIHHIRGLIDEHPHHVRIEVDRPRQLAQQLALVPGVVALRIPDDRTVEVETRTPEEFYKRIAGMLQKDRFRVVSLSSPDDNLQAVFRYLVG